MKRFKVDSGAFPVDLDCFFGDWAEIVEASKDDEDLYDFIKHYETKDGLSLRVDDKLYLLMPGEYDEVIVQALMVHELFHLTHMLGDILGFKFHRDCEEVFTYLQQYWFQQIMTILFTDEELDS